MSDDNLNPTHAITAELLAAARDSEDLKKAGKTVGKSLATIATTIDNALLPLAAVNFGIQAAKEYFSNKFQKEFEEKVSDIPPDQIVDPKPSVAGPALQGLSFSLDEPALKEMYLNLLKTSVDGRTTGDVHPAFVEIIKQLTGDEVYYLNLVLPIEGSAPLARLKYTMQTGGFIIVERHMVGLWDTRDNSIVYVEELSAMFDNWIRLGLLNIDYGRKKNGDGYYDFVMQSPRYAELLAQASAEKTLEFDRGIYEATDMGRKFARVVGIT